MMKRSVLALAVALGAITSFANAAEIYNKDGNKLDLYGPAFRPNTFSVKIKVKTEIKRTFVWALKAKPRSTIS